MNKYSHINFKPPQNVQSSYRDGIRRHENGETGSGMEAATVRQARRFSQGQAASPAWARKGNRWWGRNSRFLDFDRGTPAYAAAQLWGGSGGAAWFRRMVRQMDAADTKTKSIEAIFEAFL